MHCREHVLIYSRVTLFTMELRMEMAGVPSYRRNAERCGLSRLDGSVLFPGPNQRSL